MARPELIENWMLEAVELMVVNGLSLKQAAMELDHDITSQDAEKILRRKSFQKLLWESRMRWAINIATNPNFQREAIIGKLLDLARLLELEGKHDKAADALFKAAKTAGFIGPETNVSVFGELSAKDLEQIRETITKKQNELRN